MGDPRRQSRAGRKPAAGCDPRMPGRIGRALPPIAPADRISAGPGYAQQSHSGLLHHRIHRDDASSGAAGRSPAASMGSFAPMPRDDRERQDPRQSVDHRTAGVLAALLRPLGRGSNPASRSTVATRISEMITPEDYRARDSEIRTIVEGLGLTAWDVIENAAVFIRRRDLARILSHYELFRHVIDLPGVIVDLGIYRGASFFTWTKLMETFCPNDRTRRVYGFDWFEGLHDFASQDGARYGTD